MQRACWQARRNGCPYPAEEGHRSCCYRCYENRHHLPRGSCFCSPHPPIVLAPHVPVTGWGVQNLVGPHGIAYAGPSQPSVVSQPEAEIDPAPLRREPDQEPVVAVPHRCQLITLGFNGRSGQQLLWLWGDRHSMLVDRVIDVRRWLPNDVPHGQRWGTDPNTQRQIRSQERFQEELLPLVMGRCLLSSVVVLACTGGHHRSVATAEIAAQELERVGAPRTH